MRTGTPTPARSAELRPPAVPPGFDDATWDRFDRDGFVILESVFDEDEIDALLAVCYEVAGADQKYSPDRYYGAEAVVERHAALAELIAHPRHIGYAYDLFGEQTRLTMSQLFLRPCGGAVTEWHRDGARMVPYRSFGVERPLQLKIGYWLTDLPARGMGNLVIVPGSHRRDDLDQYNTFEPAPDEVGVCVPRGSLTIMHNDLWHRVEPNTTETVRCNLYLTYSPSWLQAADRISADPQWAAQLPRPARIIMRPYTKAYHFAKPPAEDVPIFMNDDDPPATETGPVPAHLRRQPTPAERRNLR